MAEEKKRVELEAGMQEKEASDVETQRQEDGEAELNSQVVAEEEQAERLKEKGNHRPKTPSGLARETWDSSDTLSDHRP